jgi:hypothetical protein
MSKETFPPRVFVNRTQFGSFDCIHAYLHRLSDDHDQWLSFAEHEALLREERAKAFEEAAEFVRGYTDSVFTCEAASKLVQKELRDKALSSLETFLKKGGGDE